MLNRSSIFAFAAIAALGTAWANPSSALNLKGLVRPGAEAAERAGAAEAAKKAAELAALAAAKKQER
jgi:hypothetical protein